MNVRSEIPIEAAKAVPPAAVVIGDKIFGLDIPTVVALATLLYLVIQIAYLIWKWWHEAGDRRKKNQCVADERRTSNRRQRGAANRVMVSALALSAAGLVGIVTWEGYSDRAIIPVPGDVPTIGFGTTEGVKLGDKTTPPAALARALADVERFEGALRQCVTVPLHQHEYNAFVSLAYNIGSAAFCGSTLVKKLNAGDYTGACGEILRWDKFKGQPLPGLTRRRQAEYQQCIGEVP